MYLVAVDRDGEHNAISGALLAGAINEDLEGGCRCSGQKWIVGADHGEDSPCRVLFGFIREVHGQEGERDEQGTQTGSRPPTGTHRVHSAAAAEVRP